MNSLGQRLKAVGVVALVFMASGFLLLGAIVLLGRLPTALPFLDVSGYRPHDTVGAVSDLRAVTALTAAFLMAAAGVVALESAYLDRMLEIVADVLLMAIAAMAGLVLGYWALLRLMGFENFLTLEYGRAAVIAPALVLAVSLLPPHRLRASRIGRVLAVVVLALAGPALLLWEF